MILFVNSCFRDGSRTLCLAEHYLKLYGGDIIRLDIGNNEVKPLLKDSLKIYNKAVKSKDYSHEIFDVPKQFAKADEIVIAAPFWNFGIPAALHSYIELVCTQGITFDVDENGSYYSLCSGKKLTYITTAGGFIPDEDHAFGFIKYLAERFWNIENIEYYKAEGIDIAGNDTEGILRSVMDEMAEMKG